MPSERRLVNHNLTRLKGLEMEGSMPDGEDAGMTASIPKWQPLARNLWPVPVARTTIRGIPRATDHDSYFSRISGSGSWSAFMR